MRDRLILIAATFTLICSVPATAQTPDGLTPAEEPGLRCFNWRNTGLVRLVRGVLRSARREPSVRT